MEVESKANEESPTERGLRGVGGVTGVIGVTGGAGVTGGSGVTHRAGVTGGSGVTGRSGISVESSSSGVKHTNHRFKAMLMSLYRKMHIQKIVRAITCLNQVGLSRKMQTIICANKNAIKK